MNKTHYYQANLSWEGEGAEGNKNVKSYSRTHTAVLEGKPHLLLTTDNKHVGRPDLLNPEDLLLTAASSCHLLSYLYVCSMAGVVVTRYTDEAEGFMTEKAEGGGSFDKIILRPRVWVAHPDMAEKAKVLHEEAHHVCYIANSLNFEVLCEPVILTDGRAV